MSFASHGANNFLRRIIARVTLLLPKSLYDRLLVKYKMGDLDVFASFPSSSAAVIYWYQEERDEYIKQPSPEELLDVIGCITILEILRYKSSSVREPFIDVLIDDIVRRASNEIMMITKNDVDAWHEKQFKRIRKFINISDTLFTIKQIIIWQRKTC